MFQVVANTIMLISGCSSNCLVDTITCFLLNADMMEWLENGITANLNGHESPGRYSNHLSTNMGG
jgi:hypothetical protein